MNYSQKVFQVYDFLEANKPSIKPEVFDELVSMINESFFAIETELKCFYENNYLSKLRTILEK